MSTSPTGYHFKIPNVSALLTDENEYSSHVKILGVVLDPRITLSEHTKAVSKSCFYHIRALKHIRDSLDSSMIRTIAAALVTSRLDYANSVLYGIPSKYLSPPAYSKYSRACCWR